MVRVRPCPYFFDPENNKECLKMAFFWVNCKQKFLSIPKNGSHLNKAKTYAMIFSKTTPIINIMFKIRFTAAGLWARYPLVYCKTFLNHHISNASSGCNHSFKHVFLLFHPSWTQGSNPWSDYPPEPLSSKQLAHHPDHSKSDLQFS